MNQILQIGIGMQIAHMGGLGIHFLNEATAGGLYIMFNLVSFGLIFAGGLKLKKLKKDLILN